MMVATEPARRVAVVTGASRGIGRATTLGFAARGWDVVVNYKRDAQAADEVVDEVAALGGRAFAVQADIGDPADVSRLFATVGERTGRVDAFVANAAATSFKPILSLGVHNIERTLAIAVTGTILSVQCAVPLMRPGSSMVFVSGIDSRRYCPGHGLLGMAKSALETLAMYLSAELADRGIRVNAVNPGVIDTDSARTYTGDTWPRYASNAVKRTPVGRVGTPEDVADAITFLCSEQAAFVVGQTLLVDGGLLSTHGLNDD
jgi:enoyl-[acyl-carrier protein] reductase III